MAIPLPGGRSLSRMNHLAKVGASGDSRKRRDYITHSDAYSKQLIWTERGQYPRKEINKKAPWAGGGCPLFPLVAKSVGQASPIKVIGTLKDGSGSHPARSMRYVRIAVETADGVLPPSASGSIMVPEYGQSIQWMWMLPNLGVSMVRVWSLLGIKGQEVHVASLEPGAGSWIDTGMDSDTGIPASDYDTGDQYQYCYTLVREVDGVIDESGPSPASQRVSGQTIREITVPIASSGMLADLPDTVYWSLEKWAMANHGKPGITQASRGRSSASR